MTAENAALIFTIALAAGMIAQILAFYLRVPGIVVLLVTGVVLGPDVIGIVRPNALGHGLDVLVELAVAIILFEGALSLNLDRIRREATTIRRLITLGSVVTALGGAAAARLLVGWSWSISMLFGTLVIVTGPTVITPLLRRIRVKRNVHTILEAEGVFIDPVGAIIAVVAVEIVVATGAVGLVGIPYRLAVGALMGVVGGLVIGYALRHKLVPDELKNVFTLAMVLAVFEISNAVIEGSGIMDTVVAGLVVGNMMPGQRALREFKEQLTVMLIGLLFVLLAADVRLAQVVELGPGAVGIVLVLMLLVRPLGVALSTAGSGLSWRERAFIAWIGPRGIVAAAVASFFTVRLEEAGHAGGEQLRALVFLVIALTVVVQGLTGGTVARILGVSRPRDTGYIIVGANPLGRLLGRVLAEGGEEVILIDSNAAEAEKARAEGLRSTFGNAYDEQLLAQFDLEARRGFITLTTNEGVNVLLARKAREEFRVPLAYAALHERKEGARLEEVREAGALLLFGRAIDLHDWNRALAHGAAHVEQWQYAGDSPLSFPDDLDSKELLLIAISREAQTRPVGETVQIRPNDIASFACLARNWEAERERLRRSGWREAASLQPQ